jgi:hypothetical protein
MWAFAALAVVAAICQLLDVVRGPATIVCTISIVALIGTSFYRARMQRSL